MQSKSKAATAHVLFSAGLVLGICNGWPKMSPGLAVVLVMGMGFIWEYGIQRLIARCNPWWDPKPNPKQLLEWMLGCWLGTLMNVLIERIHTIAYTQVPGGLPLA